MTAWERTHAYQRNEINNSTGDLMMLPQASSLKGSLSSHDPPFDRASKVITVTHFSILSARKLEKPYQFTPRQNGQTKMGDIM